MNFLFDFTLFVIDGHQIMLISLFPTPFDHFHFHGSGGLVPKLILTPCHMVMKCHCDDENENVKKNDLHQVAAHAIGRVGRVDWLKIETI